MSDLTVRRRRLTANTVSRRANVDFAFMYLAVLGAGMFIAAIAWKRSWQPYIGLSIAVLTMTWLAWLMRPRLGLTLTVFWSLIGDTETIAWFPFNKNLSSAESILWLSDGFSMSPLELTIVLGLVVVGYRRWTQKLPILVRGELLIPLLVFLSTLFFAMGWGVGRGGDLRIALFEARPLLYFPLIWILVESLCERPKHYRHLMYAALAAISVQGLLSAYRLSVLPPETLETLESLTEHGSSIGFNLLFLSLLLSFIVRGSPAALKIGLSLALAPAAVVYIVSQRRVAFVALVLGFLLTSAILFWRQRRTFWKVVPVVTLIGLAYVGAFWNSESAIGFPAQAIKTVIAPDDLGAADQSSDEYRRIENYNLEQTIRAAPITGQGFGQPFHRPAPMPDISFFEFHEYIPHNSLLWVWIKVGFIGFISFLYVITRSIVAGVDRVRHQVYGQDLLVSIAALLFVVMFSMYMIADIAWEPRNSVLFGVCIALCTSRVGMSEDDDPVVMPQPAASTVSVNEQRVSQVASTRSAQKLTNG